MHGEGKLESNFLFWFWCSEKNYLMYNNNLLVGKLGYKNWSLKIVMENW